MTVDIYNTGNKYKTIYMDPPWAEQGGGKIKRGADRHYPRQRLNKFFIIMWTQKLLVYILMMNIKRFWEII